MLFRSGHVIKTGGTKADRLSAFHIRRNNIKTALKLPEIVGATEHGKGPLQILVQAFVIEKARRRSLRKNRQRFQQALVIRVIYEPSHSRRHQTRNRQQATAQFPERRAIEYFRVEGVHFRFIAHKNTTQLAVVIWLARLAATKEPAFTPT